MLLRLPARWTIPSEKRSSRHRRNKFALDPNLLRVTAFEMSSPVPSKRENQHICLSAFDVVIDITSPTSLVSE